MVFMTAVVIIALLEVGSFMLIKRLNFYLPLSVNNFSFPEGNKNPFSYDLGWEPVYPNEYGYRGQSKDVGSAILSLFGDSFVKGHSDIEKSWAHLLEQKLGMTVLNFGVGGYGTDQSYLRFEKRYVGEIKTPYVLLGIMSENIARIVNRYRGFYMRRSSLYFTKPMFSRGKDGTVTLIPNPVKSYSEMVLLKDINFLRKIGEGDYWYNYFDNYGLNREVHTPYFYFLIKALPYYYKYFYEIKMTDRTDYYDMYDDPEILSLMEDIIFKFITRARENNSIPIILFFPNSLDMVNYKKKGNTVYHGFYLQIKNRHPMTMDALDYFVPHIGHNVDVNAFFRSDGDGHYGFKGERIIADGLYQDITRLDRDNNFVGNISRTAVDDIKTN
ncbi:MAG: hypothetical protein C4560_07505 [Nitrospiraceae bacterium]|nr:MAG: hypothetical protein C4560_07505 [Nitrospiraceae bacterium]